MVESSDIEITPYSREHRESVIDLVTLVMQEEFGYGVNEERSADLYDIEKYYREPGGEFWLAVDESTLAGTIGLLNFGDGRGYLKRMYLRAEYRGKGVAKLLFDTLMDYARQKFFSDIYLSTVSEMMAANRFYQREGFSRIDALPGDFPTYGDTNFYRLEL